MTGEPMLRLSSISKRFGALLAADGVSLDIKAGEIHALIGPNGAGKTTLVNLITGELPADQGSISFNGENITKLSVHQRAARGITRTFQVTSVFESMTVMENVSLAVQATLGHSFHFWKPFEKTPGLQDIVSGHLALTGLSRKKDKKAGDLSHGEKRQVAITMALAGKPKIILLDEPAAGMGPHETAELTGLLKELKGDHSMLLVEHDMDLVFSVADRISVLVYGKIIATGTPDEVKNSPDVNTVYLGSTDCLNT